MSLLPKGLLVSVRILVLLDKEISDDYDDDLFDKNDQHPKFIQKMANLKQKVRLIFGKYLECDDDEDCVRTLKVCLVDNFKKNNSCFVEHVQNFFQ